MPFKPLSWDGLIGSRRAEAWSGGLDDPKNSILYQRGSIRGAFACHRLSFKPVTAYLPLRSFDYGRHHFAQDNPMTTLVTTASFRLVPVLANGTIADSTLSMPSDLDQIIEATCHLYADIGYKMPWISYLSVHDEVIVGGGAFVGAPIKGAVEIAYFTLPKWQRQGHAVRTAKVLTEIARSHRSDIVLWAKTLPEEGPSVRVLERLGFRRTGMAVDHEVGLAWRWSLDP